MPVCEVEVPGVPVEVTFGTGGEVFGEVSNAFLGEDAHVDLEADEAEY